MSTLVLTGGGTAGHVIPHLAILPYLKNDFENIYYIGSKNGIEKNIIEKVGIKYYGVSTSKLVRKFTPKNLIMPFTVIKGINEAGKILDKLKPDIVFSKGGFVSVPTVMAAKKRKIPIIVHESDLTVGLANKISAKYAETVLTSFPETARTLKNGKFVGPPIRSAIYSVNRETALKYFGLSGKKPVLLITGGSLGAKALNEITNKSLDELLKTFDIIHICGKNNLNGIRHDGYKAYEFLDNMEFAFSACDIAVSRAGSNTLFELLSLYKPCLLIPLPTGESRGDQILNAEYFQKKGLVHVLKQELLTKESFIIAVLSLYKSKSVLTNNLLSNPVKDASREISRIIADTVKN